MCIATMLTAMGMSASTAATVGTTMQVIGTLASAGAQYQSAQYGQAMATQNAKLAEQHGMASLTQGRLEQERIARRARQIQGQQRAMYGASGVDISSGSPLEIQASTEYMAAQDKALVRYNAELKKWGFDVESANYKTQASQYGNMGKSALVGGLLGAGSTILTGNGMLGSKLGLNGSTGAGYKATGLEVPPLYR